MKKIVLVSVLLLLTVFCFSQSTNDRFAGKTVIFQNAWKKSKAIYAKTSTDIKIGKYEGAYSEQFILEPAGYKGRYYIRSKKFPKSYICLVKDAKNADVDLRPLRKTSLNTWKLVSHYGTYKLKNERWGTVIEMSKSKGYCQMWSDLGNSSKYVSGAGNQKWKIVIL